MPAVALVTDADAELASEAAETDADDAAEDCEAIAADSEAEIEAWTDEYEAEIEAWADDCEAEMDDSTDDTDALTEDASVVTGTGSAVVPSVPVEVLVAYSDALAVVTGTEMTYVLPEDELVLKL